VFSLPVSGRRVGLRALTGVEELLLLECGGQTAPALALVGCLAWAEGDAEADWSGLCATDLDALLVHLRIGLLGDRVRSDVVCPAAGCGKRVDIAFDLAEYLAHHAPEPPAASVPDGPPGWFCLVGAEVRFRLPTADDQRAVEGLAYPERALARRCIRADWPDDVAEPPWLGRVAEEMERLAPSLARVLEGQCPECGAAVAVFFDPRRYVLRELRDRAAFLYQDVDLLARRYHWPEAEILRLPHTRRANYAECARHRDGES
jgi:hypothetical protein